MQKINWRYALDELLIVIIGISIAFGLNSWTQDRKDKKLASTYLKNIASDLQRDIAQLDGNLAQLYSTSKLIDRYIFHLFQSLSSK